MYVSVCLRMCVCTYVIKFAVAFQKAFFLRSEVLEQIEITKLIMKN